MAYQEVMKNYVKFLRGTPTAWDAVKDTANADTLYFISEADAEFGKLYLGKKLIADGNVSLSTTTLGDLQGILLNESIESPSLLVYENGNWVDKPLNTVLQAIVSVMKGASADNDGVAGLVPAPKTTDSNLFLRGDATWANPVASLFGAEDDTSKTIREIAQEEVAKLFEAGDVDTIDTLQDVLDWITDNGQTILDVKDAEDRLVAVEQALFDQTVEPAEGEEEPTVIPGLVSTVTILKTDMSTVQEALRWKDLEEA